MINIFYFFLAFFNLTKKGHKKETMKMKYGCEKIGD